MKKKDIVVIFNGLGNQMSQYAFFLAKKHANPETSFIFYNSEFNHNGYELERVFGLKLSIDESCEKKFNFLMKKNIFCRLLKRILSFLGLYRFYFEDTNTYDFNKKFLELGTGKVNFYVGGWHSDLYFENVRKEVEEAFDFDENKLDVRNLELGQRLKNEPFIGIHFRRGDFLNPKNRKFSAVATEEYYRKALDYAKCFNIKNYICFSDDISWVKDNFNIGTATYVDWNKKEDSWQDMYLMSLCHININPNSTFSWWGAWLNKKTECVIVPDRFINSHKNVDLYPAKWIKISYE